VEAHQSHLPSVSGWVGGLGLGLGLGLGQGKGARGSLDHLLHKVGGSVGARQWRLTRAISLALGAGVNGAALLHLMHE
jgi:hypothetical protein